MRNHSERDYETSLQSGVHVDLQIEELIQGPSEEIPRIRGSSSSSKHTARDSMATPLAFAFPAAKAPHLIYSQSRPLTVPTRGRAL